MRYLLLTLLLALLPLSARAIIPLELVAEFELPENAVAWDVQHWMDDSTYGWAAIRNDTVFFAERTGEPIQAFHLDDSYLDTLGHDAPPEYRSIRLMRRVDQDEATVVITARVMNRDSSMHEHFDYDYFLALGLSNGTIEILFRYTTFSDYDWNGRSSAALIRFFVWPPLPEETQFLRLLYSWTSVNDAPFNTQSYGRFHQWSFGSSSYTISPVANSYDHFSGDGEEYALGSCSEGRSSSRYYRRASIQAKFSSPDTILSRRTCASSWQDSDEDPFRCRCTGAIAVTTRLNERYIVYAGVLYDASTLDSVTAIPPDYEPAFSLRISDTPEDLQWKTLSDHSLHAWNLDDTFDDTTQTLDFPLVRVNKALDGTGSLVTSDPSTNRCYVYRPKLGVERLAISYLPLAESLLLTWSAVYPAVTYQVCRSYDANFDFCEQDFIAVQDTFLILPPMQGVNNEFFRVRVESE